MTEFKSWKSYQMFENIVKHKTRYVLDPESQQFLEAVYATTQGRVETIREGIILWRAQLGFRLDIIEVQDEPEHGRYEQEKLSPLPPNRMKPLRDKATEGRANPKGIPYLYLSTDRDTAMCEARPWIGSLVSVAQFRILHPVQVVNCARLEQKHHAFHFGKEPSPEKREEAVWDSIDEAFARPVDRNDDTADYAPTQILAEFFRSKGFDGIAYRSSLGVKEGYNISLFDAEAAKPVNGFLFEVKSVDFQFQESTNPYFVSEQ